MPAVYLDCEVEEMVVELGRLDEAEFNAWFDASPIKGRLKKVCMQEQQFRCCYCRRFNDTMNNKEWDLEHVLAEKIYPQFFAEPLNLTVACKRCNGSKSQKDVLQPAEPRPPVSLPDQQGAYAIPHPHLEDWNDHLRHTQYLVYEGLTDEGHALIICCQLNGKAAEAAGMDPAALRTAQVNAFFDRFGAQLPEGLDEDAVVNIMNLGAEQQVGARTERMMRRVATELAKQERNAQRRAQLIAEAIF